MGTSVPSRPRDPRHRVRRLERRDDALELAQQPQRVDDLVVGHRVVLGAADFGQVRVLGSDARVVEPRRDGVRLFDLAELVLEQE